MPRCLMSVLAALALAVPALVSTHVQAQNLRPIPIPVQTLRGELTFGTPPEVLLNGTLIRMAPGIRIKSPANTLLLSGNLSGQKVPANYVVDNNGMLKDVWLLRDDEAARLWPTTPEEAAKWFYDPATQAWVKP